MSTSHNDYIPGVCNINRAEIASRRRAGYFGLGLFIILLVAFLFLSVTHLWRLALFIPAFIAAIGYLQAKNKFCVAYAASGQQNATPGSTNASSIQNNDYKQLDSRKARRLNLQATMIALAATALAFVLPNL